MEKKRENIIFKIDGKDKKLFKSICAREGLKMADVMNQFIKKYISTDGFYAQQEKWFEEEDQ